MTEDPNAVRVRRLYELGSSGDWDVLADSFAEDTVWPVPGRGAISGPHRGKPAVVAFFRRVIPGLESFKIEVHDILATDAHVVVLVSYAHRRDGRSEA